MYLHILGSFQQIIVICESESDLDFFADCEDFDLESDGPSDEDLNDGVSSSRIVYPLAHSILTCFLIFAPAQSVGLQIRRNLV
jgi:hypothetical protein